MTETSTFVIKIALRSKRRPAKSTIKISVGLFRRKELKFRMTKEMRNNEYTAIRNAHKNNTIFLFDMQPANITYRHCNH